LVIVNPPDVEARLVELEEVCDDVVIEDVDVEVVDEVGLVRRVEADCA